MRNNKRKEEENDFEPLSCKNEVSLLGLKGDKEEKFMDLCNIVGPKKAKSYYQHYKDEGLDQIYEACENNFSLIGGFKNSEPKKFCIEKMVSDKLKELKNTINEIERELKAEEKKEEKLKEEKKEEKKSEEKKKKKIKKKK